MSNEEERDPAAGPFVIPPHLRTSAMDPNPSPQTVTELERLIVKVVDAEPTGITPLAYINRRFGVMGRKVSGGKKIQQILSSMEGRGLLASHFFPGLNRTFVISAEMIELIEQDRIETKSDPWIQIEFSLKNRR